MSAAAPVRETGLLLDGLRCAGCVNRVETALRGTPGIVDATINYTNHRALVRYDPETLAESDLVAEVESMGYAATPYDPATLDDRARAGAREALVRVLVAAFLAGNVMWIAAALYIGGYEGLDPTTRRALRWLAIALSLPAVSWCALPFWKGAWAGLRRRELTIDVPITLGIATSFAVSILGTIGESDHLFVDSAAMIVFLILLGRTLERGERAPGPAAQSTGCSTSRRRRHCVSAQRAPSASPSRSWRRETGCGWRPASAFRPMDGSRSGRPSSTSP